MQARFPERLERGVRRVVTGIDGAGRSVVVSDERASGDPRALPLWAADGPLMVGDSTPPPAAGWWPPPGGVRVTLSSRAPDRIGGPPLAERRDWPDIDDAAGFHASRSTDVIVMIAGTIWLELDDGEEVELRAGDVLVQNGARHRWRNHGDEWPIMAVVIVGAAG